MERGISYFRMDVYFMGIMLMENLKELEGILGLMESFIRGSG